MRTIVALIAALALASCSTTASHSEAETAELTQAPDTRVPNQSASSALEFLLTSAANDFRAHPQSGPIHFYNVRIGHVMSSDGEEQYMLCGEFSSAQGGGKDERIPFATIRTSGYEQWTGAHANGVCQDKSLRWDSGRDLSSLLQKRFDSL